MRLRSRDSLTIMALCVALLVGLGFVFLVGGSPELAGSPASIGHTPATGAVPTELATEPASEAGRDAPSTEPDERHGSVGEQEPGPQTIEQPAPEVQPVVRLSGG